MLVATDLVIGGRVESRLIEVRQPGRLDPILRTLGEDGTAQFEMRRGHWSLLIASDGDRYIVSALRYGDEVESDYNAYPGFEAQFDLVGDPNANGETDLWIGGQETRVMARHVVSVDQGIAAASEFFRYGNPDDAPGRWDRKT
jgi:hypothetical protein